MQQLKSRVRRWSDCCIDAGVARAEMENARLKPILQKLLAVVSAAEDLLGHSFIDDIHRANSLEQTLDDLKKELE